MIASYCYFATILTKYCLTLQTNIQKISRMEISLHIYSLVEGTGTSKQQMSLRGGSKNRAGM